MTFSCVVIAVLGIITNGILSFERFDIGCLIFAGGGLGLWYIFNSPAIAIVAVIIIDVIAGLPTLRHVWKTPQEETLVEFLMAGAASCLTVLAATSMEITAIAYPLYILIFDGTIATIIILRRRRTIAYNQKYEDITNFCRNNE